MKRFYLALLIASFSVIALPPMVANASDTAPQDPGYLAAIQGYAFDEGNDIGPWNFDVYECTSYVAYRLNQVGISFSDSYDRVHWGDAGHWAEAAKDAHIPYGSVPKQGAVAVWVARNHVAFVDSVTNNAAVFSEYNAHYTYDPPKYDWDPPGYDKSTSLRNPSGGSPTIYIYFPNVSPAMGIASSWLSYLDTTVGQSCSIGYGSPLNIRQSMTLLSKKAGPSGTVLIYQRRTVTIGSVPTPPIVATLTYLVSSNGEMDAIPQRESFGEGLTLSYGGFEVYPAPATLRNPKTFIQTTVYAQIRATTAEARKELGVPLVNETVGFAISSAPAIANLETPGGNFSNPVGLEVRLTSFDVLTKGLPGEFSAKDWLALMQGLDDSTLYFAPRVGLVRQSGGIISFPGRFVGCS